MAGYKYVGRRHKALREAEIVKTILRYLKKLEGCFCWKEHGGMYGRAGIPDIICCYLGHFFGFEVKTETGQATELQKATMEKINQAGGTAVIVRSLEEVKIVLEKAVKDEKKS